MTGIAALIGANARFWSSVFPDVRRELRRWELHARAIPDPVLRAHALGKLREERFNAEVAATLATIAPWGLRREAIVAIVAIEVMYDYLDALSEQPVADPLSNGQQLYRAFEAAISLDADAADHYLHHPQHEDGGYLLSLTTACRAAFWSLPAAAVVLPAARTVAACCGEAQTRTHAVAREGVAQLRAWAAAQPTVAELRWWEVAAGATASVLALHALIAAAADPATTPGDAERLATAYLAICALTTLLDSLIDAEADARAAHHTYLRYYADEAELSRRLGWLARQAMDGTRGLPHASHHLMTVAGAVAFYLSAPPAASDRARRVTRPVVEELQPLIAPAIVIFELWRGAKALRRMTPTRQPAPVRSSC